MIADKHYDDVRMGAIASQITSLVIVYSDFYSGVDQRKHQSSASLAFVWGNHRDRWIPRTKGQLRGKCFHLMTSSWETAVPIASSEFWAEMVKVRLFMIPRFLLIIFMFFSIKTELRDDDTMIWSLIMKPDLDTKIWFLVGFPKTITNRILLGKRP